MATGETPSVAASRALIRARYAAAALEQDPAPMTE
jgi:hypothetical protein